jgi:hypothetical protein
VSWSRKLDEPIPLPDGRTLVSLRDAANFTAPSKEEAALPEWQAAIEALMLVVKQNGPTMFARIGIRNYGASALNRNIAVKRSRATSSAPSQLDVYVRHVASVSRTQVSISPNGHRLGGDAALRWTV